MNIRDYIESGILETYALGLCTDSERQEVEAMLAIHPELRTELNAIEVALEKFAHTQAKQPPSVLREKVLTQISKTQRDAKIVEMNSSTTTSVTEHTGKFNWLAAASVVLLVVSAAGNLLLWNKYNTTSNELLALKNDNTVLADNLNATKAGYEKSQDMLAMMNSPSTQIVMMAGVAMSPESKATIYWNKETAEVYLAINSLPIPASDKQYQLWAIVDGVPVDAGMIDMNVGDSMPHKMKDFPSAQAFAITLEKMGGSPTPTLELMYVIGNS